MELALTELDVRATNFGVEPSLLSGSSVALTYRPPGGGRLGFIGAVGMGSTPTDIALNRLVFSVIRWAADGS